MKRTLKCIFFITESSHRPVQATHEGSNYLKAARKINFSGTYTEVNGGAMVKIYSQEQRCVRLTL
jgi:hypothetical protein